VLKQILREIAGVAAILLEAICPSYYATWLDGCDEVGDVCRDI
jgi:hypothetical protein